MRVFNTFLVLCLMATSAWANGPSRGPAHGPPGACFVSDDYPKNGDICSAEDVDDSILVVMDRRSPELPDKCSPNLGGRAFVDIQFEDVHGQKRHLRSNEHIIPDDKASVWNFKFSAQYKDVKPDSVMRFVEHIENDRVGKNLIKEKSVRYITKRGTGRAETTCPGTSW